MHRFSPINRVIKNDSRRCLCSSATSTSSERFFAPENRQKIIERLQKNYSSPAVVGDNTRKPSGQAKLREAAVLVPLLDVNGNASVLFTVRSSHLSAHRNEVSFPGGSVDEADGGSVEKAALREAHEEIGVDPKSVDVWGHLPPTLSRTGDTVIKPIIGFIRGGFDSSAFAQRRHDAAEVWTVFTRDLAWLTNRDHLSFTQFRSGYSLPIFSGAEFRIWGLTAIILHQALRILVPDSYRPVVKYARPLA